MHALRTIERILIRLYRGVSVLTLVLTVMPGCSKRIQAQSAATSTEDPLVAAHRLIEREEWGAAERELRRQLAVAPATTEAHYLLGYVLFREQRATDSLAEYTSAARLRMPSTDELIVVASDYILLKDFADAERWLLYAVRQTPGSATAWYLLGRTQYNLDHAADAVASFNRQLQISPKDVRAEYNLGLALEKLDRAKDAEAAYETAIEWQKGTSPRDPQPYLDLGMLLHSQRRDEGALSALREAVALGPQNALAQQELGLVLEALGRETEAVLALQRAIQLAPNSAQPHFFLGRVYRRLGRSAEASGEFGEAKRITGTGSERETPNEAQAPRPRP